MIHEPLAVSCTSTNDCKIPVAMVLSLYVRYSSSKNAQSEHLATLYSYNTEIVLRPAEMSVCVFFHNNKSKRSVMRL